MTAKTFKQGFVIAGDEKDGVKAIQLTRQELDLLERSQDKAGKTTKKFGDESNKTTTALVSLKNAALAAIPILSIGYLAREFASVSTETDKLRGSLVTMTGSTESANLAFAALEQFAQNTPFTLDQSVQGFIKLTALGLNPSEKALFSYGNTAAAMGKDLNQMIEAVADASTMEFERLKEFGIKARQQGDTVSFTFQGVTTTVAKEAGAIEEYLQGIGENKFGDAMANQMDRLPGQLSNLSDNVDSLFRTMGDSGGTNNFADSIELISNGVRSLTGIIPMISDVIFAVWSGAKRRINDIVFLFDWLVLQADKIIPNLIFPFEMVADLVKETYRSLFGWLTDIWAFWVDNIADGIDVLPFADGVGAQLRKVSSELAQFSHSGKSAADLLLAAENKRSNATKKAYEKEQDALKELYERHVIFNETLDQQILIRAEEQGAIRATTDLTGVLGDANKDATETAEGLSDAQQKLIDKLFPLEKALKDYEAELVLINQLYKEGSPQQIDAIRRLQLQYAELFPEVARQQELSKAFETSWTRSVERIDDAFFDFFRSGLDGFDDFKEQAIDTIKDLVAQILFNFAKVKLLDVGVSVGGVGGLAASTAASAATQSAGAGVAGGALGGLALGGFSGLSSKVASVLPTSLGGHFGTNPNLMQLQPDGLTVDIGGATPGVNFQQLGIGIVQGIAGGFIGTKLGESLTGKQANSSLGATIGGIAGSFTGPWGTFIGATIGGFLDSLFGSKQKDPRFSVGPTNLAPREAFASEDIAKITNSAFGGVRFQSDHNLFADTTDEEAQQFLAFFDGIASLEDAIAAKLSDSDVTAVTQVLANQELLYKKNSLGFQSFFSDRFGLIFETIGGAAEQAFSDFTQGLSEADIVSQLDVFSDAALIVAEAEGDLKTYFDSLERYTVELVQNGVVLDSANRMLQSIGSELLPLNEQGADAAANLAELAGGLDNLSQLTAQLGGFILDENDQFEILSGTLEDFFQTMNLELPGTKEAFGEILSSLDLNVQSQRANYIALLTIVPQLQSYYDQLESQSQDAANAIAQVADEVSGLQSSIGSLVADLFGTLESNLSAQIEAEQQRLRDLSAAERELHADQLARYNAAQAAEQALSGAVDSNLLGGNTILNPLAKLANARGIFDTLFSKASGGDADAAQELAGFASSYLQIARDTYASGSQYTAIFQDVNSRLGQLEGVFGGAVDPGPMGDFTTSSTLESLLRQQTILAEQMAAEREQETATELLDALTELSDITGQSLEMLSEQFGFNMEALADKLGANLSDLGQVLVDSDTLVGTVLHDDNVNTHSLLDTNLGSIGDVVQSQTDTIGSTVTSLISVDNAIATALQAFASSNYAGNSLGIDLSGLQQTLLNLQNVNTTAPTGPSAYEQQIAHLMSRGMTLAEATANQLYALSQGADYNNDGAVTGEEWKKFKGYAGGGIANQPSIFAEAGLEAAVPIPNGYIPAKILNPPTFGDMGGVVDKLSAIEQKLAELTEENRQLRKDNLAIANAAGRQRDATQRSIETGNDEISSELRGVVSTGSIL